MRKTIILTLILGLMFVSGCSCSLKESGEVDNNNVDDNSTVITDESVVGEQNIGGILFQNTMFQVQDGKTTIVTKVTNNTGNDYQFENYQMIITDKDGVVLTILTITTGESLGENEEKTYTTPVVLDLSAASKVEYKVNVTIPE